MSRSVPYGRLPKPEPVAEKLTWPVPLIPSQLLSLSMSPDQGLLPLADHRHTTPFALSGRTVQAEKIDEPEWFAASGLRRN